MNYPEVVYPEEGAFALEDFREMDYYAVEQFGLPIELMMENAGLHLASRVAQAADSNKIIKIGVGNGNNGGGGLVASRRLAAWGYEVYVDAFTDITRELPKKQFERALKFGVKQAECATPDVWVDAYLGFSQRLPLRENLVSRIKEANESDAFKISLDVPSGYLGDLTNLRFEADSIISLAAPKKILFSLPKTTELLVADLGIPDSVYEKFKAKALPFSSGQILKLARN